MNYQDIIKDWTDLGYGAPGELMKAGQSGKIYQDQSGKRWVLGDDWTNEGGKSLQEFGRPEGSTVYQFGADGNSTGSTPFTYNNKDAGVLGNVGGFVSDTSGFWGPALAMATGANFLGGGGGLGGVGGGGEALSGMDIAADTAGNLGSWSAPSVGMPGWGSDLGMGGLEGVGAGTAPAGAAGGAATGGGSLFSGGMPSLAQISSVLSAGGSLSSILGSGGSGNMGGILSGLYDYYQQNQASDKILDYVTNAQKKIDDIYSPDSPYQKSLWDSMSAKDAAAGRNSQYGPRTQGFLGTYANDYAKNSAATTSALSGMYTGGVNKGASAGTGVATGIGNAVGGLGNVVQNMGSYLNPTTYNPSTMSGGWSGTSNAPFFYGNGGSGD